MNRIFLASLAFFVAFAQRGAAADGPSEVDGTWEVQKWFEADKKWVEEPESKYVAVRRDGVQTITKGDKPHSKMRFKVDTASKPKQVEFETIPDGDKKSNKLLGIYELDGDIMKVAILSDPDKRAKERPAGFEEDGTNWIYVYKRISK